MLSIILQYITSVKLATFWVVAINARMIWTRLHSSADRPVTPTTWVHGHGADGGGAVILRHVQALKLEGASNWCLTGTMYNE